MASMVAKVYLMGDCGNQQAQVQRERRGQTAQREAGLPFLPREMKSGPVATSSWWRRGGGGVVPAMAATGERRVGQHDAGCGARGCKVKMAD